MPTSQEEYWDRTASPELTTHDKSNISATADKAEPLHENTPVKESTALAQFRVRILVVDDDAPMCELARRILEREGYEVLTAADGLDGLHALVRSLPDLIISDLNMPRMSGFEFLTVIRERFPHIATIAVSGEKVASGNPSGIMADAILQKDEYMTNQLRHEIQRLLAASPIRGEKKKYEIVPLFVPRDEQGYLIITCPACLRPRKLDATSLDGGLHDTTCPSCGTLVRFEINHEIEALRTRARERLD